MASKDDHPPERQTTGPAGCNVSCGLPRPEGPRPWKSGPPASTPARSRAAGPRLCRRNNDQLADGFELSPGPPWRNTDRLRSSAPDATRPSPVRPHGRRCVQPQQPVGGTAGGLAQFLLEQAALAPVDEFRRCAGDPCGTRTPTDRAMLGSRQPRRRREGRCRGRRAAQCGLSGFTVTVSGPCAARGHTAGEVPTLRASRHSTIPCVDFGFARPAAMRPARSEPAPVTWAKRAGLRPKGSGNAPPKARTSLSAKASRCHGASKSRDVFDPTQFRRPSGGRGARPLAAARPKDR